MQIISYSFQKYEPDGLYRDIVSSEWYSLF